MVSFNSTIVCFRGALRLLFGVIALLLFSASAHAELSEGGRRLMEQCEAAVDLRQFDVLVAKGNEMMRLGIAEGLDNEKIIGESFQLRGSVLRRDTIDFGPMVVRLETVVSGLAKEKEWKAATLVCHALSIYHYMIGADLSQASSFAFKALEYSRKGKDARGEISALSALASIYFSNADSSGFNYAIECYNKSKAQPDKAPLYVAASNMANYLFNQGKYAEALKYFAEAENVAIELHMDSERSYIDSFHGDIYAAMNRNADAEKYYLKSLHFSKSTSKYDRVYAYICYAIYLIKCGDTDKALAQLREAENLSMRYKVDTFRIQIYTLFSGIYESKGDYETALDYFRRSKQLADTVYSKEKAREFAVLELRYRVSESQRKNAEQSMELLRRGRTIAVTVSAGVVLLLLLIFGALYYRRRLQSYREIVSRQLETAETERRLREQLEVALADRRDSGQQRGGALTDDRRREMFSRLEKLMTEENVYRQPDLSLEKLAQMLQTNRTYISQVVNEETGRSFSTYVNSYRLQEAIGLLSDPANDEPLKNVGLSVGFASPSNFYSLFRQKVGVSPSVFRANVKSIKK